MQQLTRRALFVCALSAGLLVHSEGHAQVRKSSGGKAHQTKTRTTPAQPSHPQVKFTTSMGSFIVELYPEKVPHTVANFLGYVRNKHYDGSVFHRVIPGFMVQGGGYDTYYNHIPTQQPIAHEGHQALKAGLRNSIGTIAMARTNEPHSATSQFYINMANNSTLDPIAIPPGDPVKRFVYQGRVFRNVPRSTLEHSSALYGYTVFGRVINGMEVVRHIQGIPTGGNHVFASDVPRKLVVIYSAVQIK